jgi:hypothetical protein
MRSIKLELTRFKKMILSSLTPCDMSTSIALMHEPPVAEVSQVLTQLRSRTGRARGKGDRGLGGWKDGRGSGRAFKEDKAGERSRKEALGEVVRQG